MTRRALLLALAMLFVGVRSDAQGARPTAESFRIEWSRRPTWMRPGTDGYLYNAHLSRLGTLGYVSAGDVVGYVGATGDASGPHDHVEWHPADGPAVDPNALLTAACVDAVGGS